MEESKKNKILTIIAAVAAISCLVIGTFIVCINSDTINFNKNKQANKYSNNTNNESYSEESNSNYFAQLFDELNNLFDSETENNTYNTTKKSSYDSSDSNEEESFNYTASKYYSVYTNAFVNESELYEEVEMLNNKGIDSVIVEEDGYHKVRVGSAYNFEDAKAISNRLKEKSVQSYILAYDTYVEQKIDELNNAKSTESYETLEEMYLELRSDLVNRVAYDRYVKQLDAIYEDIVYGQ